MTSFSHRALRYGASKPAASASRLAEIGDVEEACALLRSDFVLSLPLLIGVFCSLYCFAFLPANVRFFCSCAQGDTLAIDGSGWMFQLLLGQRVDHGGDYDLYHKTIVREVARLRKVALLHPHAASLCVHLYVSCAPKVFRMLRR